MNVEWHGQGAISARISLFDLDRDTRACTHATHAQRYADKDTHKRVNSMKISRARREERQLNQPCSSHFPVTRLRNVACF